MKIYLLDINPVITTAWDQYFHGVKDVEIVTADFASFMKQKEVECIVSPGNSHGIMTGGYDLAIADYFGASLTQKVQDYILKHFKGKQQVATTFIIDIPKTKMKVIHCPTMEEPSIIKDVKVVKDCMYATLIEAKKNNVKSIVIPAFGGLTGAVAPYDLAKQMYDAYLLYGK